MIQAVLLVIIVVSSVAMLIHTIRIWIIRIDGLAAMATSVRSKAEASPDENRGLATPERASVSEGTKSRTVKSALPVVSSSGSPSPTSQYESIERFF